MDDELRELLKHLLLKVELTSAVKRDWFLCLARLGELELAALVKPMGGCDGVLLLGMPGKGEWPRKRRKRKRAV